MEQNFVGFSIVFSLLERMLSEQIPRSFIYCFFTDVISIPYCVLASGMGVAQSRA
jgi:hypothetical protein